MGTTARGIVYPESGDHTRLWEHLQSLADTVEAALDALSDVPRARMTKAAQQSIPNNTTTQIAFDTVGIETVAGMADTANNRIVAPETRDYWLRGQCRFAANATGVRAMRLYVNGNDECGNAGPGAAAADAGFINAAARVSLTAGDVVFMQVYQNSGGALSTSTAITDTWIELEAVPG